MRLWKPPGSGNRDGYICWTRVRFEESLLEARLKYNTFDGPIAQLVRARSLYLRCPRFESWSAYNEKKSSYRET